MEHSESNLDTDVNDMAMKQNSLPEMEMTVRETIKAVNPNNKVVDQARTENR
jgi:hypothetical protein